MPCIHPTPFAAGSRRCAAPVMPAPAGSVNACSETQHVVLHASADTTVAAAIHSSATRSYRSVA